MGVIFPSESGQSFSSADANAVKPLWLVSSMGKLYGSLFILVLVFGAHAHAAPKLTATNLPNHTDIRKVQALTVPISTPKIWLDCVSELRS